MRALLTALIGVALGAGMTLGVLTPATAAEPPTVAPQVVVTEAVSGAAWSAPAYPVECQTAQSQVTCTPSDPAEVTAQQCFFGVLFQGESHTVCTTYEGHTQALQNAGGSPMYVEYGCSLGDVVCLTFENAGRGLAISATGAMFLFADNIRFDTSSLLWDAALDEWSFWQWAILIIAFGAMVWAVAAATVSGDREELVGALVRSFLAIPAVPISLWLIGHLLNAIDDMTWYILSHDGPTAMFTTLQSVMWAGGQANYFFAFLVHALLMIGLLLLVLVFSFRNIVLAALIAVGPVAWMLFPVRGIGPQWVVRYVSAVVVLLLTGPLTIGFVSLIVHGLAGVKTIWDPRSWPLLVGLGLVAFAPFALFGLFSFVGAVAADGIGSRLGSNGSRMATSAARTAVSIPSRVGGLPAGVRGGGYPRPGGGRPSGPGGSSPSGNPTSRPTRSTSQPAPSPAKPPRPGATPPTSSPSPRQAATPQSQSAPAGAPPEKRTP